MPVTLYTACDCPPESKIQALARLSRNLNLLFTAMATNYVGRTVSLVGDGGCGCSEMQILEAINANIVEFGLTYTGGGGGGSGLSNKVAMPASTGAAGADGDYAVDGDQFAYYVTGTGWVFIDGYQI